MRFPNISRSAILRIITIILGVPLASLLLLFGVGHLINPDVPDSYLGQNTRVCVMVILTGVVSIYALFRPYSGGFFLFICAVALGLIFHGFFDNPLIIAVLLLAVLSVIRGHLSRRTLPEDSDQRS